MSVLFWVPLGPSWKATEWELSWSTVHRETHHTWHWKFWVSFSNSPKPTILTYHAKYLLSNFIFLTFNGVQSNRFPCVFLQRSLIKINLSSLSCYVPCFYLSSTWTSCPGFSQLFSYFLSSTTISHSLRKISLLVEYSFTLCDDVSLWLV